MYAPDGFMYYWLVQRPGPFPVFVCNVIMLYNLGTKPAISVALLFRISTAVYEMKTQTG